MVDKPDSSELQNVQQTQTETSQPQTTPDTKIQESAATSGTPPAVEAAKAPPAYTPNYRFKVLDKEHEFDEIVRPVITNEAVEKKLRELYEKSYGLDSVKTKYQESKQQLEEFKPQVEQYKAIMGTIDQARSAYERGDFEQLFKHLAIDQQKVLQWVVSKVNYEQLPPEQKQLYDRQLAAEREAYSVKQENARLKSEQEKQEMAALEEQLKMLTSLRPDVASYEQAFNSRVGKPDAFRNELLLRGDFAWRTSKKRMTAFEAADEVMRMYGPLAPQMQGAPGQQNPSTPVTHQSTVPVLPNVRGGSASPLKGKKPKSLDELRALAASRT